ncbi:glycosyltransferase family 2 protein [Ulvibacterium marinum]|uniref:Glycosyltransferase family 2 protein n=1 Tax=Ulvibacterium marinum TaxID=2419782 RepID=A0A3B0BU59_9FLAO|nr:glycosyltransferase family A protein [Ulvibacterium marinum]RKN76893.1 glycosyltransferase family 2 protein [Ulvibacterium marinum]
MKKEISNAYNGITVIMPTYNQSSFIAGAIKSLQLQTFEKWELLIINDGSTDNTDQVIHPFLKENRIKCFTNPENKGLGACLNIGIENASYSLIGYLPSDDLYYKDHLNSLFLTLKKNPKAILACSGLKYYSINTDKNSISKFSETHAENFYVQPVQVVHKKTPDRWSDRNQMVTSDLFEMFWKKIETQGECIPTKQITCEWTFHANQRHKKIMSSYGGSIYKFKAFYNVNQPIRFHDESTGEVIDEKKDFRPSQIIKRKFSESSLKILLVGELSYNADRICAFEDRGHKLYGLWIEEPNHYNAIGPFPFGNIEDIPIRVWKKKVNEIQPDIIYALLNFQAVPLAYEVLSENTEIPFIWHFKEGPFYCRSSGLWEKLIHLLNHSDGQIFINRETREWYTQYMLGKSKDTSYILDGDLPSQIFFSEERSELLSDQDGEIHTLSSGRLIGLEPEHFKEMADQNIHLHFYGNRYQMAYSDWIKEAKELAPNYLHLHPNCFPENWVQEFSKYDAGWLHVFKSRNEGETARVSWDDLNYPARMSTLAAAGVPMIQRDNKGHIAATQSLIRKLDCGVFFKEFRDLGSILRNKDRMQEIRENMWKKRDQFSFDYHVEDLLSFFRKVIESKKSRNESTITY